VFQLGEVLGAGVGKFVVLGVAPDVFGGIQFRSVSGQVLDADATLLRGHELWAFFNVRPSDHLPVADGLLVALQRPAHGRWQLQPSDTSSFHTCPG